MTTGSALDGPTVTVQLHNDGSAEIRIDDAVHIVPADPAELTLDAVSALIAIEAARLGRPLPVMTFDPTGSWPIIVHPDGRVETDTSVEIAGDQTQDAAPAPGASAQAGGAAGSAAGSASAAAAGAAAVAQAGQPAPANAPAQAGAASAPAAAQAGQPAHASAASASPQGQSAQPAAPAQPAAASSTAQAAPAVAPVPGLQPMHPVQAAPAASAAPTRRGAAAAAAAATRSRRSFIAEERERVIATRGMRGAMAKMGLKVAPSAAEADELADLASVSRHWTGPRTIAIVNGKGGAGKTPTTAMLSAVFARNGGAGVLAWDNNETRGTLGWRTEQGEHDATIHELLPNAPGLLGHTARVADLNAFVHHQSEDRYDVLRSNPNVLAENQRLTSAEFDAVHAVAAKYFRLIVIDSGNDESAERWRRMVDQADQLVIATTAQGEHAEAGALLLEALRSRDARSAHLADQAVVVVSQSDRRAGLGPAEHIATGFRPIARDAVVIPYDPAMRDGKLRFDRLAKPTKRAWLAAAGAVADGL